jgi:hypothetical protein
MDRGALDKLYADDLESRHWSGARDTKASWLRRFRPTAFTQPLESSSRMVAANRGRQPHKSIADQPPNASLHAFPRSSIAVRSAPVLTG